MRNRLPSLLLKQKNTLSKAKNDAFQEKRDNPLMPNKIFKKWQEACVGAFKVMDKEIKLQEDLDCSCSGTTAVVIVKQVNNKNKKCGFSTSHFSNNQPIPATVFFCSFRETILL